MSWMKYMLALIISTIVSLSLMKSEFPVDNNAIWLGLCVLGNAFIAYREK